MTSITNSPTPLPPPTGTTGTHGAGGTGGTLAASGSAMTMTPTMIQSAAVLTSIIDQLEKMNTQSSATGTASYGSSPSGPVINAPGDMPLNQSQEAGTILNGNPVFTAGISFTAVMGMLMNQIAALNSDSAFIDSQDELKVRASQLDMAKANATLTVASYNAQSQEQINNAIQAFTSAAVDAFQMISIANNVGKANRNYDDEVSKGEEALAKMPGAPPPKVGPDTDEQYLSKPNPDASEADQKAYIKEYAKLQNFKSPLGQTQYTQGETKTLDQKTTLMGDIMKQSMTGITSMNNAQLKVLEGAYESQKQINQGYMTALQSLLESIRGSVQSAQQGVSSALDAKNKIADANIKWNGIF